MSQVSLHPRIHLCSNAVNGCFLALAIPVIAPACFFLTGKGADNSIAVKVKKGNFRDVVRLRMLYDFGKRERIKYALKK